MLYIHGGGFVACSARSHRPITSALAKRGFRVFSTNYRLAPEHPFPAASDDVLAVWHALRSETEAPLVVAGDSAGGTLALSLVIALRDRGERLPAAAALFSPATDLTAGSPSYRENVGRDAMFSTAILERFRAAYLRDADPRDPRISPLLADLAGLPPILLHVGERELLRDDSVRFAAAAKAAGVRCELKVWPVVPHVWQFAEPFMPEARRSLDAAAQFLHTHARSP
jgi:acetyl esterase/lipase